jgi:hypothetical protein
VAFALPAVRTAADIVSALAAVAKAVDTGILTPDEAQTLASVPEVQRRAIETAELERRVATLERRGAPPRSGESSVTKRSLTARLTALEQAASPERHAVRRAGLVLQPPPGLAGETLAAWEMMIHPWAACSARRRRRRLAIRCSSPCPTGIRSSSRATPPFLLR